jgi:hypothetical protein
MFSYKIIILLNLFISLIEYICILNLMYRIEIINKAK